MQDLQPSKEVQHKKKSKKKLWIILGIITIILIPLIIGLIIISVYFSNRYYDYTGGYNYDDYSYLESSIDLNESKSLSPLSLEQEESTISKSKDAPSTAAGSSSDDKGELTEQKVIKTGTVSLQVEKAGDSVTELTNLAQSKGGFVLSSSLYTSSDETQSGTVTLKVPVLKYEESMNEIKNLGDVEEETSSGQDVTEQFSDLKAQLKNYKAEEAQYVKILERANSVDDILKVTKQLSAVRENIEVTEGRIKYLEGQTDMSTITVSLYEETRIDLPTKEWEPYENLKKAFRTWIQFLQSLVDAAIWIIIFLGPVVVIVWIIVKLIIKKVRKNKSNNLK